MIELNNLILRVRCFSNFKYHSMINIPANINEIGKYLFIIGLIHSVLILPQSAPQAVSHFHQLFPRGCRRQGLRRPFILRGLSSSPTFPEGCRRAVAGKQAAPSTLQLPHLQQVPLTLGQARRLGRSCRGDLGNSCPLPSPTVAISRSCRLARALLRQSRA